MSDQLGRHWLLLRGLARESAHWCGFDERLQQGFPNARITTLDLPGTGNGHRETSPVTIDAITRKVRSQAQERGVLRQPVTLLAISLGGMVAWEWLLRYPDDSCGAILLNTSFAGLNPFYQRLRWQSYGSIARMALCSGYQRERAVLRLVGNDGSRHHSVAEDWARIQAERPISALNTLRQLVAAAGYSPPETRPVQPLLLLNTRKDRLVAPDCSAAISKKWALPLREHPWAGHDLILDDGAWVVAQARQWLAEQGVQPDQM